MKRIIVDSCCDLTAEIKNEMGIVSVPLTMLLGDKEFFDDENLDIDEFMGELKNFKGTPGSSAPSPYSYKQMLERVGDAYIVTLSSKLSASHNNAVMGKEQAEEHCAVEAHVFDSKSASAGETLIAIKLRELINGGLCKGEIVSKINHFIDSMKTYFVLENFDNLRKNGRMSKIQGSLAQLLNMKLIAGADGNGEITLFERCRGMKQMVEKLLNLIGKHAEKTECGNIVISHCNNRNLAEELKKLIKERFNFKTIYIVPTGGISSLYADDKGIILAF